VYNIHIPSRMDRYLIAVLVPNLETCTLLSTLIGKFSDAQAARDNPYE